MTTVADTRPAWLPQASEALTAAIADDWPTAARAVESIARTYGTGVVPAVLLALIDTMIARTDVPTRPDAVAWQDISTGEIAGADGVPPATRWAGRLMMARASDDQATLNIRRAQEEA